MNYIKKCEEFRRKLDLVEAILVNKFPQLSIDEIQKMLDLREADVTQTRFYQEVLQIGEQKGERLDFQSLSDLENWFEDNALNL